MKDDIPAVPKSCPVRNAILFEIFFIAMQQVEQHFVPNTICVYGCLIKSVEGIESYIVISEEITLKMYMSHP